MWSHIYDTQANPNGDPCVDGAEIDIWLGENMWRISYSCDGDNTFGGTFLVKTTRGTLPDISSPLCTPANVP